MDYLKEKILYKKFMGSLLALCSSQDTLVNIQKLALNTGEELYQKFKTANSLMAEFLKRVFKYEI